jgi:hypothetical protein
MEPLERMREIEKLDYLSNERSNPLPWWERGIYTYNINAHSRAVDQVYSG